MIERLSPFRVPPRPNRGARRRAARGALTEVVLGLLVTTALPAKTRALTVFDPLNYQENLLSAARAQGEAPPLFVIGPDAKPALVN
jgi:hypothetical protein